MRFKDFLAEEDLSRNMDSIFVLIVKHAKDNYSFLKDSNELFYSGRWEQTDPFLLISPSKQRTIRGISYHNNIFDEHGDFKDFPKRNKDVIFMTNHLKKTENFTGKKDESGARNGKTYVIIPVDSVSSYAVLKAPDFYYAFKNKLNGNLKFFNLALKSFIQDYLETEEPEHLERLLAKANADKTTAHERTANYIAEKYISYHPEELKRILDNTKFAKYLKKADIKKIFEKHNAQNVKIAKDVAELFIYAYEGYGQTPFEFLLEAFQNSDEYVVKATSLKQALALVDPPNKESELANEGSEVWFNGKALAIRLDEWESFKSKFADYCRKNKIKL